MVSPKNKTISLKSRESPVTGGRMRDILDEISSDPVESDEIDQVSEDEQGNRRASLSIFTPDLAILHDK